MNKQPDTPPIALENLHKKFCDQTVLNGISLQVEHGETVAVLGRSGTGKSVLLKLIIGLQPSDSGSVTIEGQQVTGLDVKQLNEVRKKIGFLFQQAALYDSLTVEENVAFPLRERRELSEEQILQVVFQANRVQFLADTTKSADLCRRDQSITDQARCQQLVRCQ